MKWMVGIWKWSKPIIKITTAFACRNWKKKTKNISENKWTHACDSIQSPNTNAHRIHKSITDKIQNTCRVQRSKNSFPFVTYDLLLVVDKFADP